MIDERPDAVGLELRNVIGRVGGISGFELAIDELDINRGEAIALAGPSGSGKSTALNLIGLSLKPVCIGQFLVTARSGDVVDVGALWRAGNDDELTEVRAAHHGFVLQQGGLLPYLSVRQNIMLSQWISNRLDSDYVDAVAFRLGIAQLMERTPSALSVGERQRVAIARSLVHRPDLILADEPTASVHPTLAEAILGLLVELSIETSTTVIASTHDPERATKAGFRVVELVRSEGDGEGVRSTLTVRRHVQS